MAKRFTGTEKWDNSWFCDLSANEKLFWIYLLDKCDHAGIWQVNWKLVKFHIGNEFNYNPANFTDRIIELSPTKWFIPKFIGFQYLTLNPANRAHQSVITKLQKEGASELLPRSLEGPSKPLARGTEGLKVKDKDKDKDKDKVKDKDKETEARTSWFEKFWEQYPQTGRVRKKEALKRFLSSVPDDATAKRCAEALEKYKESKRVKGGFVQNAPTWFGDWHSWEKYENEENGDNLKHIPQWMKS